MHTEHSLYYLRKRGVFGLGVVNIEKEMIVTDLTDTSIRIKRQTKEMLDRLDFVSKNDSYNSIIIELIDNYRTKDQDHDVTLHERTN